MKENIKLLFKKTFGVEPNSICEIAAHGSSRKYFRCSTEVVKVLAAYNSDKKENIAFIDFAKQLKHSGINVPAIIAVDEENDIYLLEDLGNTTLFDFISTANENEIVDIYSKIVRILPKIQIEAGRHFDYTNAYPRKAFDVQSLQWDLNYFKYYFLKLADIPFNEQELENDFEVLKNYLLDCDCEYLLYRDFQSRNIMLKDNYEIFFIDFQGARKGALQYDIASLLYDAKANLSPETREKLLNIYIEEVKKYKDIKEDDFRNRFYAYVYIRIMQAMGSYGYRGYFQKKEHFLKSIPFAIENIRYLENNINLPVDLPCMHGIFQQIITNEKLLSISKNNSILNVNIKSFSFKKGYPHDTSGNGGGFIFDCRALPNPGRYEEYKSLNGLDASVIEFLETKEEVKLFFESVCSLINQSCAEYQRRGFSNLSVYFGCTGGQHRSVFLAQKLANYLKNRENIKVNVQHIEQNQ
jgi:aminoglycoside/choline kinase family phosphotransferase